MRYFVTGSSGLVGNTLVSMLLGSGMEVVAQCRPTSVLPFEPNQPSLRVLRRNLQDLRPEDFAGCDVFVHLAAQMPDSRLSLAQYMEVNVEQTLHAFAMAKAGGVRRSIHIGTCSEFGLSSHTCERLSADSPLRPVGGYGVSKAMASLALMDWACESDMCFSLLRLFHTFGEGEKDYRFWPGLRKAALAGEDFPMTLGEQLRDFTPVTYVADRIIHESTRRDLMPGRPCARQIGTGYPCYLRDFARYWWKHWGGRGKLLFGAIPYREQEIMSFVPEVEELAPRSLCPWISA